MIWFIADNSGGETYFVLAGPTVSKEEFFDHVLRALDDDDPQCAPYELSLHKITNDNDARHWIWGVQLPKPRVETWNDFHKRTLIGELKRVYPGEWELKETV